MVDYWQSSGGPIVSGCWARKPDRPAPRPAKSAPPVPLIKIGQDDLQTGQTGFVAAGCDLAAVFASQLRFLLFLFVCSVVVVSHLC